MAVEESRLHKKIPAKYQPKGFHILYEDRDIIVGNKSAGVLTVGALYDRIHTVHYALNQYIRKGNSRSRKHVFVVHRLDRETSGILIFAKTPEAQSALKENWSETKKTYWAIVHGRLSKKEGMISSYLTEDEDYMIHSSHRDNKGKLSHTAYKVLTQNDRYSLVEIDLLTGRKNQIRVHLSQEGHPIVGDKKYGQLKYKFPHLALHSKSISLKHPFSRQKLEFEAPVPHYFYKLILMPIAGERGNYHLTK